MEFKKLLIISALGHLLIGALSLLPGFSSRPKLKIDPSMEAMNVMWAETAVMPDKTIENKLPAPEIPQPEPAPVKEEAKVVPKDTKVIELKPTPPPKEDMADRKKKLSEALANLGDLPKEKKPMPRPDNFPSTGESKKVGLPAGPQGGGTSLLSNPSLNGYKLTVQKIITGHFVWFKKEASLYAEIAFTISSSGDVNDPRVSKSSGEVAFDQAALRAVLKSSPLPKPPSDMQQDIINETFVIVFDTKRMRP